MNSSGTINTLLGSSRAYNHGPLPCASLSFTQVFHFRQGFRALFPTHLSASVSTNRTTSSLFPSLLSAVPVGSVGVQYACHRVDEGHASTCARVNRVLLHSSLNYIEDRRVCYACSLPGGRSRNPRPPRPNWLFIPVSCVGHLADLVCHERPRPM